MEELSVVKKLAVLSLLGGSLVSGAASAATCVTGGSGEASLQDTLDNITVVGNSSVSAANDCLSDDLDSSWILDATGGAVTSMIIELAGQATSNTFGVYETGDSGNLVQLFDGAATAGSQATLTIKANGDVLVNQELEGNFGSTKTFGFYLGTKSGNYFSNTSLNGDGTDHMLAYQGTGDQVQLPTFNPGEWTLNEYILAWEDLRFSHPYYDGDFNDMVLMVESVQPVPVPAAVWLFGSGLLGLVGIARRKKVA